MNHSDTRIRSRISCIITFTTVYRTEMAAGTKRALDEASGPKAKKTKVEKTKKKDKPAVVTSTLVSEDVDFPRGGGTSFTPLEVKAIRAEGAQEADQELFKVRCS